MGCFGAVGTSEESRRWEKWREATPAGEAGASRIGGREWQARLPYNVWRVARAGNTEDPFTGRYQNPEPGCRGDYLCACCGAGLFAPRCQYNSGTGWPSFKDADPVRVKEGCAIPLVSLLLGVEVLCRNCGAHLGHVFSDGPPPQGRRFCINSVALVLREGEGRVGGGKPEHDPAGSGA